MKYLSSQVTINGSKLDIYKRTMSEIIDAKGLNINMKMIELGLAALYPFQKGCGKFKKIENKAKSIKIGIWSDQNFELPWDYRKRMVHNT
jgi:endonuclease YncB( thermonuclease family)